MERNGKGNWALSREGSRDSVILALGLGGKMGHLLEDSQGLMFPAELAEEEAVLHSLKMEQCACGCV